MNAPQTVTKRLDATSESDMQSIRDRLFAILDQSELIEIQSDGQRILKEGDDNSTRAQMRGFLLSIFKAASPLIKPITDPNSLVVEIMLESGTKYQYTLKRPEASVRGQEAAE